MDIQKRPGETFREYIERKKKSKGYAAEERRRKAESMYQRNLEKARSVATKMVNGQYKGNRAIIKGNKPLGIPDVHVVHNKDVNAAMLSSGQKARLFHGESGNKTISVEEFSKHNGQVVRSRMEYRDGELGKRTKYTIPTKTEKMLADSFKSQRKKFGSKSHLGSNGG